MRYIWVLLLVLNVMSSAVFAQVDSIPKNKSGVFIWVEDVTEWGLDLITFEKEKYTFLIIPTLGYEERTGVSIGLTPSWRFYLGGKDDGNDYFRPSSVSPSFEVSTSGMYEFVLSSLFYTKSNWFFQNKSLLQYMPDRYFYLGNNSDKETYSDIEQKKWEFSGKLAKIIGKKWFLGIGYDIGLYNVKNTEGDVFNQSVKGYGKSTVAGFGPTFTFDNRNNVVYPESGSFIEGYLISYIDGPGDYGFSSLAIDGRTFISLGNKERVIGFQGYCNVVSGDVPFYRMASIGGKRRFRGVSRPYKYIDNNSVYFQAAYRSMLIWRFGYELFTGLGNVFSQWDSSVIENVHLMGGVGLRIRVLDNEKLNFRIDYGMTNRGDSGVFFTLGEAF